MSQIATIIKGSLGFWLRFEGNNFAVLRQGKVVFEEVLIAVWIVPGLHVVNWTQFCGFFCGVVARLPPKFMNDKQANGQPYADEVDCQGKEKKLIAP